MRHRIEGERLVEAEPAAVWSVLSDFHRVDRWAPRVKRVVPLGPAASGLGMARRCDIRGLGHVDEVVNVWEDGRRLGYRVTPVGPIGASQSLWELQPDGTDGTRVRLQLDYDVRFGAFGELLHVAVLRRLLERALPDALALLRRAARREASA